MNNPLSIPDRFVSNPNGTPNQNLGGSYYGSSPNYNIAGGY